MFEYRVIRIYAESDLHEMPRLTFDVARRVCNKDDIQSPSAQVSVVPYSLAELHLCFSESLQSVLDDDRVYIV